MTKNAGLFQISLHFIKIIEVRTHAGLFSTRRGYDFHPPPIPTIYQAGDGFRANLKVGDVTSGAYKCEDIMCTIWSQNKFNVAF